MAKIIHRESEEGRRLNRALIEGLIPDARIIGELGATVRVNVVTMDSYDFDVPLASFNGQGIIIGRGVRCGDAFMRPMVEPLD